MRSLERLRVGMVHSSNGDAIVVLPDGTTRTWKKGDTVPEENATVKEVSRSTLVLTRSVTSPSGVKGESLIVVRFDASGGVLKVREYASVPDVALPTPPKPK